jgi:tryptophan 2,3-dioxygenase
MSKESREEFKKEVADITKKINDLSCLSSDELEILEVSAKSLAYSVRNSLENFHIKHIKEEHMKELNTIIRNSIFTHLVMLSKANKGDKVCAETLQTNQKILPPYWEKCQMI